MQIIKYKLARCFSKVQGALRLRAGLGGCSPYVLAVPSPHASVLALELNERVS